MKYLHKIIRLCRLQIFYLTENVAIICLHYSCRWDSPNVKLVLFIFCHWKLNLSDFLIRLSHYFPAKGEFQYLSAIFKKLTPGVSGPLAIPVDPTGVDFINSFTLYAKVLRSALNFYS